MGLAGRGVGGVGAGVGGVGALLPCEIVLSLSKQAGTEDSGI